ncbi:MAG: uracil-DNA glycosylase [Pseudobdellovibrionaceae bacterium]
MTHSALEALRWYVENGVTDTLLPEPVNKKLSAQPKDLPKAVPAAPASQAPAQSVAAMEAPDTPPTLVGSREARAKAEELAKAANTLEELADVIRNFDGLAVKKTAMNMVFSDGNPKASVMVIGEAPGADEDREGKPFVGASGQLLDKIFASIGLSRKAEDPKQALYISNILNWRPPGNRTPTPAEMSIALPFIEKHIALIQPRILVMVGNTPMKTLLDTKEGIVKMRGSWHDYKTVSDISTNFKEPVFGLPTFHPAFLLRNPMQKKTVWHDMLLLHKKRAELGLV